MTDFTIPCATVQRLARALSTVLPEHKTEWTNVVRIEGNIALASNRRIMVMERISNSAPGVTHLKLSPALLEQCGKEAPFDSVLTISVNEALSYAVGKTTLGYIEPGNCVQWTASAPNFLDNWRWLLKTKHQVSVKGGMFWEAELIAALGASSPSGRLVFPEKIDVSQPIIVRDVVDDYWCGVFACWESSGEHTPAKLPEWVKP